jgi:hypothetical protein
MNKIGDMLSDNGLFYIERNVFVEQESYYMEPIFGPEEQFGSNHMMNFWPGRQQFVDYLNEFFQIEAKLEYGFGEMDGYRNLHLGLFCRKRQPQAQRNQSATRPVPHNYYAEHLHSLKTRAQEASVRDLKRLAATGIRNVNICGDMPEVGELHRIIHEHEIFAVKRVVTFDPARVHSGWSCPSGKGA